MTTTAAPPNVTVDWEVITPEMAEKWLGESVNEANRNIRRAKATQYARDMTAGKWTDSNDAIVFDEDGKLINGQHRLSAVVLSGVPTRFLVIRGYARATQLSMDAGASRLFSDHVRMTMGAGYSSAVAAAARQMVMIEKGVGKSVLPSAAEQLEWLERNPDIFRSVQSVAPVRSRIDSNPTGVILAHFLIARENGQDLADAFVGKLLHPADEPEGSAIFAVLNRLRATRDQQRSARNCLNLLVRGWNKWATDTRVRALPFSRNDTSVPTPAKWGRADLPYEGDEA